jgi:hypothetical protein
MVQHGQVFKLKAKGANGQALWAYRVGYINPISLQIGGSSRRPSLCTPRAGKAMQPRALEPEQGCDLGLGTWGYDQPLAGARPPRSRSSQARAWRQPWGGPAASARRKASSVPCSCPMIPRAGKARRAASCAGVRWWRCRRSAAPAPARVSASAQAATPMRLLEAVVAIGSACFGAVTWPSGCWDRAAW